MKKLLQKINSDLIVRYFLAFVVIWFVINELLYSEIWTSFVPDFLSHGNLGVTLVIAHGIILCLCGLSLVLYFYPKIAGAFLALMLLEIIFNLIVVIILIMIGAAIIKANRVKPGTVKSSLNNY